MRPSEEVIGTIVIDRAYFLRHSRPFFLYRFPLQGKVIEGRQLFIAFSIVGLDKGEEEKYFCETDQKPLGIASPACCAAEVWKNTSLQTIIDLPLLDIHPDTFAWEGFRGQLDIAFQDGAYNPPSTLPAAALQSFITGMEAEDYKATRVQIRSFPSVLGDPALNREKANMDAASVFAALKSLNPARTDLTVNYEVEGPDWERVGNMIQTAQGFNSAQKDRVLEIVRKEEDSGKAGKLMLLDFYEKLKTDILSQSRHVYMEVRFDYTGSLPTLGRYPQPVSLLRPDVESNVARTYAVRAWQPGDDIPEAISRIDHILSKKADANLYAMRASYRQAQKDYTGAIADLEQAARLNPAETSYQQAISAYKILFAESYDLDARLRLLEEYNRLAGQNRSDRELYFNRAVLMEKCGLTAMAMEEYEKLFEGSQVTASQLNNRGVALMKAFHLRDARYHFERAAARDGRLAEPYFNLAVLAAYQGLERSCIRHLEEAIARDARFKGLIFNNPAFSVLAATEGFRRFRN
ncbi:MAG: hypothetical protein R3B47_20570 [Bacteroidia bacterium]